MDNSKRIWAIVPAAGVGRRMGADMPKQYLAIDHRCVLQITLDKLLCLDLHQVIVSISNEDNLFQQKIQPHEKIKTVIGGAERASSVLSGLAEIIKQGGQGDWVLVHDAARPCVAVKTMQELISIVLQSGKGGLLAYPAADTLKSVENNSVVNTLDRSTVYLAHTPQMFPVKSLFEAIHHALNNRLTITDESSAMEYIGYRPQVIADTRDNIKITSPEDLAFAKWLLLKR